MTRLSTPEWRDLMARERASLARAESVVAQDAQEHKAAARFDRFGQTRVGDRWYEDSDVPSEGDL